VSLCRQTWPPTRARYQGSGARSKAFPGWRLRLQGNRKLAGPPFREGEAPARAAFSRVRKPRPGRSLAPLLSRSRVQKDPQKQGIWWGRHSCLPRMPVLRHPTERFGSTSTSPRGRQECLPHQNTSPVTFFCENAKGVASPSQLSLRLPWLRLSPDDLDAHGNRRTKEAKARKGWSRDALVAASTSWKHRTRNHRWFARARWRVQPMLRST
jgi:hypothetical protein